MDITLPPLEDIDENGYYIGNDINFLIKNENKKEDIIESLLNEDIPSTIIKTELFMVTNDEFDKLRKHIGISDYSLSENGYDTIIIQDKIFKKSN